MEGSCGESGPLARPASSDESYFDLGTYRRQVTTADRNAQVWFERGLIWCYGFNHDEAASCFETALAWDPDCAMALWGLAYSLGPNYNKPWAFFGKTELQAMVRKTHDAVQRAGLLAPSAASEVEKALIGALQARYPKTDPDRNCSIWSVAYADAMEKVYRHFPHDLDVAALYADAMLNLTPWALWDLKTGKPSPSARTLTARTVLERAMTQEGGMQHPGLLHLYIHLMEMSPTPEAALRAADQLRGLVPGSGHLNHMPTHIDMMLGDYQRSIKWNQVAYRADEDFLDRRGALNFYTLYRMHDYHFCINAAMFAAQSNIALETTSRYERTLPEALLRVRSPPMADWLEGFLSIRLHVLIRFGRWRDIIDLPLPRDRDLYCVTTAMTHYAKAVASASLADMDGAEAERGLFAAAYERVPTSRMLFNNKCVDILKVAETMMNGEIEYRRGNYDAAFGHLRDAIGREDGLPWDEPWAWMQPSRHAYGALLLEQGRFDEAAAIYEADLGLNDSLPRPVRHPRNVWALHGYHESLLKLGRTADAAAVEPALKTALERADVKIRASCFCRLGAIHQRL